MDWKRHGGTALKVLMYPKAAALVGLLVFILYGIGWDTVWRPSFDALKTRDEAITKQRGELTKKQALQQRYTDMERQLRNLTVTMLPVHPGNSATVVALGEAAELLRLAQGEKMADRSWPGLPKPHDSRENVLLTPTGSVLLDLRKPSDKDAASPGGSPANEVQKPTSNPAENASPGTSNDLPQSVPVERFDYDLKATGTYPALMDLLNELVTYRRLIKINQVQIVPNTASGAEQPDASTYPDFPIKLDMTVSLSLFLYADNAPSSSPVPSRPGA
jgi:hypothetical protein